MGSGYNNRKKNDQPIIKRPIDIKPFGLGIPGGSEVIADICIPAFEVRVKKSNLTVNGVQVRLKKNEDNYQILIGENVIGILNKSRSAMITKCSQAGIKYTGVIAEKKDSVYARFIRVS